MSEDYIPFNTVIEDVTKFARKIEKSNYLDKGKYPIIDQGKNNVAGYTQDKEGLFTDIPAIIFGDHTRIIKYIDKACFIGADGVKLLKLKSTYAKDFDYRFLYYYFSYQNIPDTGYNRHFKWLKAINIYKPSIVEQKNIAVTLDKVSELIALRKKQLEELDALAESVFYDIFGDPVKNEKGWEVKQFEEYIEYIGDIGSNGSNETVAKNLKMTDIEDFALMVRTINLSNNDFTKNVKYVSEETYNFFKKSKIYGGEIIMNKIGSAGDFWLMPCLNRPVSLGLNQLVIRTKNINLSFLYNFLSTDYGKTLIKSKTNGAITKSITKTAVKKLEIFIPPLSLQNQFASIIEKIESQKSLVKQALQESEDLFQRLMHDLFKPH